MSFKKIVVICIVILLVVSAVFIFTFLNNEKSRTFLTVAFLDIGQGDAIFIETPNGNQVLIDAGPTSAVVRKVSEIIPFYDRSIDLLIVTHYDLDHAGGFPEILKRYQVGGYATSNQPEDGGLYLEVEELSKKERSDRLFLKAGDRIILDRPENIYLDILWPPSSEEIEDRNDASVVARLVYRDTSFMLTGDAPQEVEERILSATDTDMSVQVLKVGHHGSRTSTSEKFVSELKPKYGVVSAGLDNKFDHPHDEVLKVFKENKTIVLETFISSTIVFQSDGKSVWLSP